jgi:DNA primase
VSDKADLRYVSAKPAEEAMPIKSTLYGWDYVRHAAIVVEGPTDAWRIGPGAVATLGTSYSKAQVLLLTNLPVRVVCFDRDNEAQRRAKRLCCELAVFPGRTVNVCLESHLAASDPGGLREEVNELRQRFL